MNSLRLTFLLLFSFGFLFTTGFAQSEETTASENQTITLTVKGIGCAGDLPIINNNVEDLKGVSASEAVGNPAAKVKFRVTFDPKVVTREEIVAAIEASPCCDNPEERPYKVKKK